MMFKGKTGGRGTEEARVAAAEAYLAARLRGDVGAVLGLVSDDIVLESSRDGRFSGKEGFSNYLQRVPPTGLWDRPPVADPATNTVRLTGRVRVFFVPVRVAATMHFAPGSSLISKIVVGRA